MILVELTTDHDLKPFDCGDADLNGFLMDNAKLFAEKRIGKTFLLMDGDVIAAYFCLFNDKISRLEVSNSAWRKVKKLFPHGKHFCSYPAVKIGRFAVAKDYHLLLPTQSLKATLITTKHQLMSDMKHNLLLLPDDDEEGGGTTPGEEDTGNPLA